MEDRRADAEEGGAGEEHEEPRSEGRYGQPNERASHAERQRIGLRPMIGIETDDGLQQRSDALINQRDKADLPESKIETALENGIDRRQQRRRQVIEQMTEADRGKNRKCGRAGLLPANDGLGHGWEVLTLPGGTFGPRRARCCGCSGRLLLRVIDKDAMNRKCGRYPKPALHL